MNIVERFVEYAKIDTQSDSKSMTVPSTEKQKNLGNLLVKQLRDMGIENAHIDDKGYVYAKLESNTANISKRVGFIAHMDTATELTGANVNPQFVEYKGGDIKLNDEYTMTVKEFPCLNDVVGETLITTDGNTLLGADDKSGIAIIMDAVERIITNNLPHGDISIGFTPDEEIGRGANHFDVEKFAADFAYTIDGGEVGELEYESFNACSAYVDIKGKNVHPGSAKDIMRNSLIVGHNLLAMLPQNERPEHTEHYDGFYHLLEMKGDTENTHMEFIIRDFDREKFENKKSYFKGIVDLLNQRYDNSITLKLEDSYYNMKEKLEDRKDIIDLAYNSMLEVGITPKITAIRGGTDGSRLSFMGLPCPNIFAGGYNFHGRFEFIPVSALEKGSNLLLKIVENIVKGE
ncbi:MAG: peptidase T [Peptoniphilaceae bacterium]|uniref:peptidase T n=1 Tax=Parvimonas sp. TaxID=1944660 RepID=UPI0025EAF41D|nr:peptidase T [Parvimonas sp.]MCI5997641.1 peptidase T [Parvimonas sp.]MDD7765333.1 peptidase T [Peptoniphilaceae bacterium]MDY3051252.1 peptidase T [Parvimonas sp.]